VDCHYTRIMTCELFSRLVQVDSTWTLLGLDWDWDSKWSPMDSDQSDRSPIGQVGECKVLQPRELPQYFNELNNLFQDANITDEGIKKAQACWYVDINESKLWQALPNYTLKTYKDWKKAVLALYPGATEDHKWSMANLDQLLGSTLHMGIMNSEEYAEYYHKFFTITQFLIRKS